MKQQAKGFTFLDILIVISVIAFSYSIFIPSFEDTARKARIVVLENIAGGIRSTMSLSKAQLWVDDTSTMLQTGIVKPLIVKAQGARLELNRNNFCPQGKASTQNAMGVFEFMQLNPPPWQRDSKFNGELYAHYDDEFAWVGYDIPRENSHGGCYLKYDSLSETDCKILVVTESC